MAAIEEKLCVLLEKLKETDHNLSVCIVLLQQYIRSPIQEPLKRAVAVQVGQDSRSTQTCNDEKETQHYERSLSDIFQRLKTELVDLHDHLEQQRVHF